VIAPSRLQKAEVAGEQVDPTSTPGTVAADPVGSTGSTSTVPTEPKRRGRPKKEEVVPAEPEHVPTPDASAQTADAGTTAEPADASDASSSTSAPEPTSAPAPTMDDVRAAFLALQEAKGLPACIALLKTFSDRQPDNPIKRVAELPEAYWAEALEACRG
jgi:hypothetical protein